MEKNIKRLYKNNKFKITAPTSNDIFNDRLFSVLDIQDYLEYILKKYGEKIDYPSIGTYKSKMEIESYSKLKQDIIWNF